MNIAVKQKHIDDGVLGCGLSCTISIAILEALKLKEGDVYVGQENLMFRNVAYNTFRDIFLHVQLPESVKEFIYMMDNNCVMDPSEFEIPLEKALKLACFKKS